jgi:hypothetical protein
VGVQCAWQAPAAGFLALIAITQSYLSQTSFSGRQKTDSASPGLMPGVGPH